MKPVFIARIFGLLLLGLLPLSSLKAQTWDGSTVSTSTTTYGTKVGIGISSPTDAELSLRNEVYLDPSLSSTDIPGIKISRITEPYTGLPMPGNNIFEVWVQHNPYGGGFGSNNLMTEIDGDGNIRTAGIMAVGAMSLPTPSGYSLYVAKGILTERLKVASSTDPVNWSDFVFNKDYKLMPIHQLESFISQNAHLPEIPTANEVAKDGIDVANMDAKLLQKIEELTLYVIQQQKEIDELKKGKK
ncbi:MAG: hypothetical protein JSS96_03420 [Bacteroidetes bacterium]|nr:hypothetical protein [Bacteroidota bacterium]